jgi:hypothetical protein
MSSTPTSNMKIAATVTLISPPITGQFDSELAQLSTLHTI